MRSRLGRRVLDDSGKPIRMPGTFPTVEGTKVWPSVAGANNWYSPSYSPKTGLLYISVREAGSLYFFGEADYKPGDRFDGGGFRSIPGEEEWGAVRGVQPRHRASDVGASRVPRTNITCVKQGS